MDFPIDSMVIFNSYFDITRGYHVLTHLDALEPPMACDFLRPGPCTASSSLGAAERRAASEFPDILKMENNEDTKKTLVWLVSNILNCP